MNGFELCVLFSELELWRHQLAEHVCGVWYPTSVILQLEVNRCFLGGILHSNQNS